ncbi:MAG: class II fructose-bisphosphate aldolase, partial [Collinsella intestinalis]
MLVNAADMLKQAEAGHYALGAFNTNNLEWTLSILQAAEEAKSPLIIQCTGGAAKWMGGYKVCADMVKAAVDALSITVPVALHLDHGSYGDCFKCIEAGFTSIMYDGSHEETFQLNLDRTAELVKLAHEKGMSIEAEVGGIGGVEDGVASNGELADPAECKQIADLGVDFLACGIGNI